MTAPSPRTYYGHLLWPVLDDDTGQVIGWDVHEHGDTDPCSEVAAELLPTLAAARAFVRDEVRFRRTFGWLRP